jgi:hypothetical protein
MKNKAYHTCRYNSNSIRKIVDKGNNKITELERDKIDPLYTWPLIFLSWYKYFNK